MTKRVVLMGHPVAHSLSGAMQQAAFDSLGIDATYELWDRSPMELAAAIEEIRGDDFLGANVTIPHKERVVPMVDRLTDEAHVTGAVNTITREGKRLIGHNTDVPGFRVALDRLVGKQKMPRQAVVLGAGGGARAVVYGLITEGFQRIVVFNRHLHRAEGLVKHFGRSAAHMELRAMPWHDSIIESELAKTRVLVNATSIGLMSDERPDPGRGAPRRPARARPHLRPDPAAARRRGGRSDRRRRRADAPPPGRRRVHPVDRPARPARADAVQARRGAGRRAALGRGRAVGRRRGRRGRDRRRAGHGRRAGLTDRTEERPPAMGAFRFLTAGESHGPALGVTIEGVPAGLALTADDLAVDLARRQRGYGRGARQAIEQDRAEILAGVRHGTTLGSPILLLVRNRDWENWTQVMAVEPLDEAEADALREAAADGNKRATPVTRVRPGHADLAGALKYDFNDVRNVLERASARETAARVAAGGVARAFLRELGIEAWSFTAEVGGVALDPANATRSREESEASPLRCPDPDAEARMVARIDEARSAGDTVGGVFEVVVHGLPIGLGSYVHWDRRLDAALAAAVMSINIVKGVEFGLGFEQTRRFGSAVHDVIEGRGDGGRWVHRTNNAGGLTGGVTNGEPLVVRGAVKPISTLARPLPSADLITGEAVDKAHYERSDISVVPAAGVVGEAMVMLTLASFVLEKFGGDTVDDVRAALDHYRARTAATPEAPVAGGRVASPAHATRRRRPATA